MDQKYGRLREEDLPALQSAIEIFRSHNLHAGLHGTSLWNGQYKDVDLLVFSQSNDLDSFKTALKELLHNHKGEIIREKGNEACGLDYDLKMDSMILHLSFVIIL